MKSSTLLFLGSASALSIQQRDPEANAFIKFPLEDNFPILQALPFIGPLVAANNQPAKREAEPLLNLPIIGNPLNSLNNLPIVGDTLKKVPVVGPLLSNNNNEKREAFIKFPLEDNFPILQALPFIGPLVAANNQPPAKREALLKVGNLLTVDPKDLLSLKFGGEINKRDADALRPWQLDVLPTYPIHKESWVNNRKRDVLSTLKNLPVIGDIVDKLPLDRLTVEVNGEKISLDELSAEDLTEKLQSSLDKFSLNVNGEEISLDKLPIVGDALEKLPIIGDLLGDNEKRDAEALLDLNNLPVVGPLVNNLNVGDKLPVDVEKLPVVGGTLKGLPVVGDLLTKRGVAMGFRA